MADEVLSLSDREREVLALVATGASNQEIARALVISPNTVKVHLRNIFAKLGVQSRTEATMEAVRRGWVSVPASADVAAGLVGGEIWPIPRRTELAPWQRVYMAAAALVIALAISAPVLLRSGRRAVAATAFSDVGQPQAAAEMRTQLPRWNTGATLPAPRSRLALIAGMTELYAIGGETASGVTGAMTIYDPTSNRWLSGPAKPAPVANVAGAMLDGRVYVPGGTTPDGSVSAVLEVYDPDAGRWETRAPLPEPRTAYALAALDGKLYLFGGWDGERYRADVFVYDPATDAWSSGAPLPGPRGYGAAAALDGEIYVVGGFDGEQELDRVDVYDPADEEWTTRAPLSEPRAGLGLASLGPRLYAIGGGWADPATYSEQYDAGTAAWSRIESPVLGEWRNVGVAAHAQSIYAVGGWSQGYLDVNAAYEAIIRQLLPFGSKGE